MKSTLGLIAKILVVLALPLLLFSYVDSQPVKVTKDDEEDDKGTRSVAVVNEDLGYASKSEEVVLGQQITSVLNEQDNYSWVVVNRSAAEQGFEQEEYDAILYVPSSFSENVMTFKDESPEKASVNYVIQPNLVAKERQRIHREMANAKSAINHEMSTIYWSYVSQEVDNIRVQFDKILEKEIAFQDAMYSFYTPSSETLANEIDRHKNRLEGILEQTNRVDEASRDNANSAKEAEDSIAQFTEALETYKERQSEQERLLSEFQMENQELVQAGIEAYNQALENSMNEIEDQYKKQSVLLVDQKERLTERFGTMQGRLNESGEILTNWRNFQEGKSSNQETNFEKITLDIVEAYSGQILQEWLTEAEDTFDKDLSDFTEAPITATLIEPIEPDFDETGDLTFEKLEGAYDGLISKIARVKKETESDNAEVPEEAPPEGEPEGQPEDGAEGETGGEIPVLDIDWTEVDQGLENLYVEIERLKETNPNAVINNWEKFAKEWEENYRTIIDEVAQVDGFIVKDITEKQKEILANVSGERKHTLKNAFDNLDDMENKSTVSLVSYLESLSVYQTVINQRANINETLVEEIIAEDNMQKEIKKLFEVDYSFVNELEEKLGVANNRKRASLFKTGEGQEEDNFNQLVNKAQNKLTSSNENFAETIEDNKRILNEMSESTNSIADQIREVNAESFDWEESPSVEYLDGQMVFQFQQGTASGLENLSDLVASLGENQNNITSDTEELQETVGSVQAESDELNNRWSSNVANTEQVKGDVYDVLGNTVVDGQSNPYVYDYLSNPVTVEGQVDGKVLSETEDRMPPVVLFIIILLSGLLIGFLTQYYSSTSYFVQGGLFVLLTLAVGLIISIYGLNIYPLDDSQAIMWSAFTILLLMACANIVRAGLFVGPFVGWLASLAMIMFFISPLLDIVVPEFSFTNPISNVYMGLLFGSSSSYILTMIGLVVVILLMSALIYTLQVMRGKAKAEELDEEQAS